MGKAAEVRAGEPFRSEVLANVGDKRVEFGAFDQWKKGCERVKLARARARLLLVRGFAVRVGAHLRLHARSQI